MSDRPPQQAERVTRAEPLAQRRPLPVRLRFWGAAILLIGLAIAAPIYILAPADPVADPAAGIASGLYEYNIERIGGKAAVYTDRFNRWLAGLWHGRPLAGTIAVLALVVALAFFWAAHVESDRKT